FPYTTLFRSDVAVEQSVPVAVLGDQQQAAVEVAAGGRSRAGSAAGTGEPAFRQHVLDADVEAAGALRAFAHGGEDAQAVGVGEGFGRVCRLCEGGPVGEEVVAVGLQRVGVAFVEVHAGEFAAAQQCESGIAVTFAHGGGEGSEVEFGALAPAAGEV